MDCAQTRNIGRAGLLLLQASPRRYHPINNSVELGACLHLKVSRKKGSSIPHSYSFFPVLSHRQFIRAFYAISGTKGKDKGQTADHVSCSQDKITFPAREIRQQASGTPIFHICFPRGAILRKKTGFSAILGGGVLPR